MRSSARCVTSQSGSSVSAASSVTNAGLRSISSRARSDFAMPRRSPPLSNARIALWATEGALSAGAISDYVTLEAWVPPNALAQLQPSQVRAPAQPAQHPLIGCQLQRSLGARRWKFGCELELGEDWQADLEMFQKHRGAKHCGVPSSSLML